MLREQVDKTDDELMGERVKRKEKSKRHIEVTARFEYLKDLLQIPRDVQGSNVTHANGKGEA